MRHALEALNDALEDEERIKNKIRDRVHNLFDSIFQQQKERVFAIKSSVEEIMTKLDPVPKDLMEQYNILREEGRFFRGYIHMVETNEDLTSDDVRKYVDAFFRNIDS